MKELLITNMDVIIAVITVLITYVLGLVSKKSKYINNNVIAIQNIIIGIIVTVIYYLLTGDFSMVIASSSPIAAVLYDAKHGIEKLTNTEEE